MADPPEETGREGRTRTPEEEPELAFGVDELRQSQAAGSGQVRDDGLPDVGVPEETGMEGRTRTPEEEPELAFGVDELRQSQAAGSGQVRDDGLPDVGVPEETGMEGRTRTPEEEPELAFGVDELRQSQAAGSGQVRGDGLPDVGVPEETGMEGRTRTVDDLDFGAGATEASPQLESADFGAGAEASPQLEVDLLESVPEEVVEYEAAPLADLDFGVGVDEPDDLGEPEPTLVEVDDAPPDDLDID